MRKVLMAIAAAVSAGVIVGLVSRVGMALVAIASGHTSQFSFAGTASILFIYCAAMIPGALVAAFTRGPLRWLLPAATLLLLISDDAEAARRMSKGARPGCIPSDGMSP